jgi:hypothetical protein
MYIVLRRDLSPTAAFLSAHACCPDIGREFGQVHGLLSAGQSAHQDIFTGHLEMEDGELKSA